MAENENKKLTWHKWYVDDVKALKMAGLSYVQIGELFCKIMESVEKGEMVEVSEYIKVPYCLQYQKVVVAQKAYANICEKRAKSGSKGGKVKAANRKAGKENGFNGMSKTDFRNMAKYICHEYEEQYVQYKIDNLFERLTKNEWKYGGAQITTKKQLECIVYAEIFGNCDLMRLLPTVLEYLTKHNTSISLDDIEALEDNLNGNSLSATWNSDDSEHTYPIRTDEEKRFAVYTWFNCEEPSSE